MKTANINFKMVQKILSRNEIRIFQQSFHDSITNPSITLLCNITYSTDTNLFRLGIGIRVSIK